MVRKQRETSDGPDGRRLASPTATAYCHRRWAWLGFFALAQAGSGWARDAFFAFSFRAGRTWDATTSMNRLELVSLGPKAWLAYSRAHATQCLPTDARRLLYMLMVPSCVIPVLLCVARQQ